MKNSLKANGYRCKKDDKHYEEGMTDFVLFRLGRKKYVNPVNTSWGLLSYYYLITEIASILSYFQLIYTGFQAGVQSVNFCWSIDFFARSLNRS